MIQPLAEKNGNRLEVVCDADIGTMHADLTKVRQVLFNLLSNACKFTEQGTVSLAVQREASDGDAWLTFTVEDTGIGLNAEQLGRLFQEFSQADTTTARKYGGTGLGLALEPPAVPADGRRDHGCERAGSRKHLYGSPSGRRRADPRRPGLRQPAARGWSWSSTTKPWCAS